MSTTLTPPQPPAPPAPGPSGNGPQQDGPRSSARVIAILAIVLGSVLIVGAVFSGAFSAVRAASQRTETLTLTADATGIRSLDVDVAAADLTIVYGGDTVSLDVQGGAADWRLGRDGDSVTVRTDRGWWGGWRLFGEGDVAVLTLPQSLASVALDADLSLSAGALRADGRYSSLDLDLSAGSMSVSGTAQSLDADVSAGRLVLDLDGVDEADLRLSAGAIGGELTGRAPQEVTVDVSAGRLELTLPDASYAVASDVSAGEFQNRLTVDAGSDHRVSVSVSAGFALLRS